MSMDLSAITEYFIQTPEFSKLKEEIGKGRVTVGGLTSGGRGVFLSSLFESTDKTILIVTATGSEAEELVNDLNAYTAEKNRIFYYPHLDVFPFEDISPDKDLVGKRLNVLDYLLDGKSILIVAPIRALAERTIPAKALKGNRMVVRTGQKTDREALIKDLVMFGYSRQSIVGEKGEFSVRGGIIDIFSSSHDEPVRIEFLGETVESIRTFDPISQLSLNNVGEARVLPAREMITDESVIRAAQFLKEKDEGINKIIEGVYFEGIEYYRPFLYPEYTSLINYLPEDAAIFLDDRIGCENILGRLIKESEEIRNSEVLPSRRLETAKPYYLSYKELEKGIESRTIIDRGAAERTDLGFSDAETFFGNLDNFADWIKKNITERSIYVTSKQAGRLYEILLEKGIVCIKTDSIAGGLKKGAYIVFGDLSRGFSYHGISVLSDNEIFAQVKTKEKYLSKPKEGVSSKLLSDLKIGDHVVHVNHGIGIYRGLNKLKISGAVQEYIEIEYADGDKLYVPLHLMGMVQKYSSLGEYKPKVNKLGGADWIRAKAKAKRSIKDITNDLIEIYSARKHMKGFSFPADGVWQSELEQSFPYEETPDQKSAVIEVKKDMESAQPMDRLVCGDVGYGKTEVAIRAAFKAATSGKQVAVLVPTTVLAEQHFRNFSKRFKSFPVVVEMLSRFRTRVEQQSIIKSLGDGAVDIIIGTHRLLQDDVKFRDLGLLIVDEEQRFGVAHKEKIKKLKKTVDVLTLSATPIPRTLYMAISGARDMSMINTPPLDRSPIKTYLHEWNEGVIHEAILREIERGGQVYFVYNFVRDIDRISAMVKRLVPTARVAVAHGQMGESELESVMIDFLNRNYDVLVCSTIIESGIDIPSVNTIIIDHAERLGLSQLYQLRGRVGRSSIRAYAYLLYHKEEILTETALQRLAAIQEFTALGSGYKLAMKDLEIRGAGNILGAQQHGHILSIGFDLYCDLLEEVVKEIKKIPEEERKSTYIDLKVNAFIPQEYVPDEGQRIALYRRMNFINSLDELDRLRKELEDRFGKVPVEVDSLFEIIVLKIKASKRKVESIQGGANSVKIILSGPYDKKKLDKFKDDIVLSSKSITLKTSKFSSDRWFRVVSEIVDLI